MSEIFTAIIITECFIAVFAFGIGYIFNIWIYYCEDEDKFPMFPILNPFSFASFELILSSMFTFSWKIEGNNRKLKRNVNRLIKFSGIMVLIIIVTVILSLVLS